MNQILIDGSPVQIGDTLYIRRVMCPLPLRVKFTPGRVVDLSDFTLLVKCEFQLNKSTVRRAWFYVDCLRRTDKE